MTNFRTRQSGLSLGLALAGGLFLGGCADQAVQVYTIPKEQNIPQISPMAANAKGQHNHGTPHLHWKLPAGWKEERPERMRVAVFSIAGDEGKLAKVTVTPLPGVSGIELDSLNIWRKELGLPDLSKEEFARAGEPVEVGDGSGHLYEMAATAPVQGQQFKTRTLGVIHPREGALWFLKLTGEEALVAAQKEQFVTFLKSVEFHAPDAHEKKEEVVSTNTGELPKTAGLPDWHPPQHWQAKAPGAMLLAAFTVPGDSGSADLTISKLPGDAGGLLSNVVRWRRQMGLGPIAEAQLSENVSTVNIDAKPVQLVDILGKKPSGEAARMLVLLLPDGGETWFYKLMGPDALVSKEKNNLLKMVEEAH
jgi:hypothetical protein